MEEEIFSILFKLIGAGIGFLFLITVYRKLIKPRLLDQGIGIPTKVLEHPPEIEMPEPPKKKEEENEERAVSENTVPQEQILE